MSVFRVTGLKILGRVGTHMFFFIFFWKKYNLMHFERQSPFKMHKIIHFPEILEKIQVSPVNLGRFGLP